MPLSGSFVELEELISIHVFTIHAIVAVVRVGGVQVSISGADIACSPV